MSGHYVIVDGQEILVPEGSRLDVKVVPIEAIATLDPKFRCICGKAFNDPSELGKHFKGHADIDVGLFVDRRLTIDERRSLRMKEEFQSK